MNGMKFGIHGSSRALLVAGLTTAILLTAVVPDAAEAQRRPAPRGGAGYFAAGASFIEIGALNSRLEAHGYPTFQRSLVSLGGGGYSERRGGLLVGGEGYGVIAGNEAHQGRTVSLGGGYGLFNVGYAAELAPRVRVYPMLGLGAGGMALNIGSAPTGESFDDVLENPNRSATMGRAGFLLSAGGGLEFRTAPVGRAFVVGVRAGYLFAPSHGAWVLGGDPIGGGPDASLEGAFVRLIIGGGR